ncbi:transcript variant X2 [Nothobranchius furzeri]|uniref:Transcript variant X2 n=1 Tax=Nothobranchius furzeri TaxID=105023 RepID=A0A9D2YNM3_NOTFU|nr:transcript variant X2 [Nothobranchius furzeri]
MGPSVLDTVEDLRNIQQSLWELHKLLTDLPDDMLEDSRDSSSPELECSNCSNQNASSSPQCKWTQEWSDHAHPPSHAQIYDVDFDQASHDQYAYEDDGNLLPHTWNQNHPFAQERYPCTSVGSDKCTENSDFSTGSEAQPFPEGSDNHVNFKGEEGYRRELNHEVQNTRHQFQNVNSEVNDQGSNQHQVRYKPHHAVHQPKVFHSQAAQQDQFGLLQREFLDSTQQNADRERSTQLQILNKAQQRQIEDLERKLEDSRRNMRYLEHQFAIVKDEKDGLTVSYKESSRLVEDAKEREVQMQHKLQAVEQQVQLLRERDQENLKKQRLADAAVDSMKQQMLELCRSDTLSKSREQHDRDLAVMKEQHEVALLALQQKLDSTSQALSEQFDVGQKLREQVKLLERQREEEHLERAKVVNSLSQRLEESQHQCAKLLQTNTVQEMSQMQIKLQQAQAAKALSENMSKVLQEDLADLKEQITLYESAVKHSVITLDLSSELENHLSESCMDLGLKKTNRKNGTLHRTALAHLSDSKLPKDEALKLLQVEMQRCLGCLKGKRRKISQLQEELQHRQTRVDELQTQLEEVKLRSSVKAKHSDWNGDSQKELTRLQEDKRHLMEQVELLENKNKELKQSEEKLKSVNSELCSKMREMIQELDQEKQEAAERSERINQQYRDDVVNRVRTELLVEHEAQTEQLTAQHRQQIEQLQNQLSEVSDKMLAVQECYISVCKEKSLLEETVHNREKEETSIKKETEEKLRRELEAQHQASITQLKAVWSKEKETEVQQQVDSCVASTEAKWKHELEKREKTWLQRLEEASKEGKRQLTEAACQTDKFEVRVEDLDSRLRAQKQQVLLEADKEQCRAVEEARRHLQRELEEKHLEDMAKQVEGAVTRAYNRWIEDLPSLPEYQTLLQSEKEKWEELQERVTNQKVSQALREAEELRGRSQQEDLCPGVQGVEELQVELAALRSQLEQLTREQAALLRAELAGARAAWNREKQQEVSSIQVRSKQTYQTKLQEERRQLEQALQQAREDADLQRKELLLQMEAKVQQTARAREEEWRCQRRQMREEFIAELQTALEQVQNQVLGPDETEEQTSGSTSEVTLTHIIKASCREMVNRAAAEAKRECSKMSEEQMSQVSAGTPGQRVMETNKMNSAAQRKEQPRCSRGCSEMFSKLQKKNQELQRHLEKTCRQLQLSVREHKAATQHLKDQHERSLQKVKEEHQQQLEEVKKAKESSGSSDHHLQQGLEEMKQQYLVTVEKIRGDMLRYLQESRERAAEMIRIEVQRERRDTARQMRRYYLTCLQELLEDGGKTTGQEALIVLNLLPFSSIAPPADCIDLFVSCRAEKKIMNAASKLAAMAKVLETPVKSKSGKNHSSPSCAAAGAVTSRNSGFSKNLAALTEPLETHRDRTASDSGQNCTPTVRTKLVSHRDPPRSQENVVDKGQQSQTSSHTILTPHKSCPQTATQTHVDFVSLSVRGRDLEWHMQGSDSNKESGRQNKPFLVQEAPVREEKPSDWSVVSSDSNVVSRLSYLGRKVEPVRPFSVSAGSPNGIREFGGLTPDASDLTVYKDIPTTEPLPKSSNREPIPGSECEAELGGSRPPFSELRRQQDSGFDSPFYQQH